MRKLTVICAAMLTAASGAVLADGASTYKEVCSSCHESGAEGDVADRGQAADPVCGRGGH